MIIGIDATRANKSNKTGVEWYSYHLIRALARANRNHTIRLYFRSEPESGLRGLGPNVEYRMLRWPLRYLWTQIRLSLEMLLNPPDVLFIPAQIIPLIHPTRTVTTIHDVAYKPYPKSYSLKSRLYLDFAAKLAVKLPLIITVSEFSKREIIKYYGADAKRIVVTYLGFTHEDPKHSPIVLTKHGIRNPYLVFIGRLERKKNVKVLVESFNLIKQTTWGKDLQLVLAGVKGHGWEEIDQVITLSPFQNNIKVIGWITEEQKHSLLERADAFILVSAYEGFGLPLLEAMAAGTPAIASNQAALPEIAGDAAVLIARGDRAAIRDAVRAVLVDQKFRADLIAKGNSRVKLFTWEKTARETLDALADLPQN